MREALAHLPDEALVEAADIAARVRYGAWLRRHLPAGWAVPPHLERVVEAIEAVERGEIDRLAISMPPRHGKTEAVTLRYPLYRLLVAPTENVLVTGYNERYARELGRLTRNAAVAAGIVADDKTASDLWSTRWGGRYVARGVGSPPTGLGFSRIVIDDPIRDSAQAESAVYRDALWEWYTRDVVTRVEPGGALVIIATRWHHDDLVARATAAEPGRFHVINLPAIDGQGRALWPERYPVEALEQVRAVNPAAFEALYQGRPTPREGALFLVDRLAVLEAAPQCTRAVRAWDLGASTAGDWTVGILLGISGSQHVILDVARGRWEPAERNRVIRRTAELDGRDVTVRVPIDPGAAGVDAARALASTLAGYRVVTRRETGSKRLRAEPVAAQLNAGNVAAVRGPWLHALVEELRVFPAGAHDDQVDALSAAFNELAAPRPSWQSALAYLE